MILTALFLRPVRRAPLRFLVTVLGVGAGVAELVATLAAGQAALSSLREGVVEIAGRARLEITAAGGIDENVLGTLRPIARDAVILPIVEEIVLCPALNDTLKLVGIDPLVDGEARAIVTRTLASASVGDAAAAAGADALEPTGWREFLAGDGVWIATTLARKLGLGPHDGLTIDVLAQRVTLPILGTFEPPSDASAFTSTVWIDVARAQELTGRIGRVDRIELVPRAGVELAQLQSDVALLLPPGPRVAEPLARQRETNGMVRSLEFNLSALAGISMLVGAVLVATTLATSVVERRATVALLRSLGADTAQIVRAVLCEALCIGTLGGALGVGAGFAGAHAIASSMRATAAAVVSGAPPTPIRFDTRFALVGLALGVCVSLAAAALPVLEAVRTPPIQNLRSERPSRLTPRALRIAIAGAIGLALLAAELIQLPPLGGLPVAALLAALCLLGALFALGGPAIDLCGRIGSSGAALVARATPLRLASAALAAGRRRAAWAAGAVGVAVALAVSIATLVVSFRTTVVDWTRDALRADLSIRPHAAESGVPIGRLHPSVVTIATDLFGADAVDPFHTTPARVAGQRITLAGAALDVVSRRGRIPFRAGPDGETHDTADVLTRAFREHAAVVNEAFALRFACDAGDRIAIEIGGATIERTVAGVFFDYGDSQGLAIVDIGDYLTLRPGDGPRDIAVFLPPGHAPELAREELRRALAGRFAVDVLDNREVRTHVLQVFDNTFAITRALQVVATLVAVVAVLSVLFALVSERRADLALLSALGASRWQVGSSVCLQAGALGAIGAAGGAIAGLAIGFVLVTVVNLQSFRWTLHFVQPWEAAFATSAGVALACLAAGVWPAVRATRASVQRELREEG